MGTGSPPMFGSMTTSELFGMERRALRARYDTAARPDPFAASRESFDALVAELGGEPVAALSHDRLEELLDTRGRQLLRQLLQDHLDLRAVRETRADQVTGADGRVRCAVEHGHTRQLATLFGKVIVTRMAYRAKGAANLYLLDAVLNLPHGLHSHGLRKAAVLEAVCGSFDAAKAAIRDRCGNVAGKRQLEQLVQAAARDIDAFYRARVPAPCTREVLVVISVDGKGIVMRPEALRQATAKAAARKTSLFRTRLAGGEKPNRKRMATLATVYDAAPAVRRPHDVIATPGGRSGARGVRPGPHAKAKRLTGSVAKDPDQVIAAAFAQAASRDPDHRRPRVVLVDGAVHQLDLIQAEAARQKVKVHIVVDLVHVLERLWAAARCFHAADDPAGEDWVAVHALKVLAGHAHQAADAIEQQTDRAGLAEDQRQAAQAAVRYLRNKAEFLRYDIALAAGWPIATRWVAYCASFGRCGGCCESLAVKDR
jgi:hypothetical protein